MALTEQQRRIEADRHIASLARYARAMESEGDYAEAQAATDESAEWEFWAVYGVSTAQWDEQQRGGK